MPDFVPSSIHQIHSTWAIATEANKRAWPRQALVWEASDPYLYARHNAEGRVILGGEDEELTDAASRDRKIGMKAETIRRKFNRLYEGFDGEAEFAWSGFSGRPVMGCRSSAPCLATPTCSPPSAMVATASPSARWLRNSSPRPYPASTSLLDCFKIDRD